MAGKACDRTYLLALGLCLWQDHGVPNGVMQNQLMVSTPPIIPETRVSINYQGLKVQLFQASGHSETSLSGT